MRATFSRFYSDSIVPSRPRDVKHCSKRERDRKANVEARIEATVKVCTRRSSWHSPQGEAAAGGDAGEVKHLRREGKQYGRLAAYALNLSLFLRVLQVEYRLQILRVHWSSGGCSPIHVWLLSQEAR